MIPEMAVSKESEPEAAMSEKPAVALEGMVTW
jgi:hypothetical protein